MTLPDRADIVVVGGGHNGLACAAYLARAGRDVLVLEARGEVGGCASTVAAVGARVNICNCDHTMVLASGIVEDLGLAGHGLRYLDVDPVLVAVSWDGSPAFVQWRSIERTIDGLAMTGAGNAYRRYLDEALPAARLMLAVQGSPASTALMVTAAAKRRLRGSATLLRWARRSLLDVLGGFGFPPWLISYAATNGPAVWGLPPDAAGTGLAALGFATRHLVGVGRPVGGSGALPTALAACVRAHGGRLVTGVRVTGVAVRDGRVRGVRLDGGGHIAAQTVITAIDPRTLIVDWLDGVPAAAKLRAQWAARPRGDGYESKLDAVAGTLPVLRALTRVPADVLPASARNVPTTVVSPSPAQQIAAAAMARDGLVSDPPMFLLNTPSVLDETMRPDPGSHVLSLEVLWTPYALRGGWDGSAEPWRWLERLATLCEPGLLESVRDWRAMTPPDYEREFSMTRGYAPSFPGGAVAALTARQPELSRYRTPVRGLYLTGAGTFPGAGVWGASGRNTASVVLATAPGPRERSLCGLMNPSVATRSGRLISGRRCSVDGGWRPVSCAGGSLLRSRRSNGFRRGATRRRFLHSPRRAGTAPGHPEMRSSRSSSNSHRSGECAGVLAMARPRYGLLRRERGAGECALPARTSCGAPRGGAAGR